MIADLKPYPAMKNSGVPWLGEVPEHWGVPRLGTVLRERGETNDDGRVAEVLSVMRDRGVIPYAEKGNVGNKKSEDITRYKIVRPDDIVVNCMNVIIGSVGLSRYTGCLSPVYYVLTQRSARDDPRYLSAYFQTRPFQESLVRIGNGILAHRMRIPMELLKCELFPRPPLVEQSAIVRFLDHLDRRIRRYIRAKQKLVKLLEEQKQAITHRAVTRGLDPNVRVKPSGVDWLVDVPEHWEIWQIGHFAAVGNGSTPSRGNASYWAGGKYPWLNSSSVNAGEILESDQFVTEIALRECHLPRVPSGSVLVAITGQGKTRGTAAVLKIEATINQHIAFITPLSNKRPVSPEYLRSFLVGAYFELRRMSDDSGSTKGALTCQDLRHFRVALPPFDEQIRIVRWTMDAAASISTAINRAQREIDLLREYRSRLISDVVTGKLDVREVAMRLPDEVDESELLDEPEADTDVEADAADEFDAVTEEAEA
jgi:type I restriction enzyme, S subunit